MRPSLGEMRAGVSKRPAVFACPDCAFFHAGGHDASQAERRAGEQPHFLRLFPDPFPGTTTETAVVPRKIRDQPLVVEYLFGADMNTHQVTLNGKAVAVGRDRFKLLTMVRSLDHHDEDGKRVTTHELVIEGVDAFGTVATAFIRPVQLKEGDIIQILIGETHEEAEPVTRANAG